MYKLIKDFLSDKTSIQRVLDGVFIPADPANTDYQEYLEWLEEGNTPLPADEPNEGTA
jgi:hypothetical protein